MTDMARWRKRNSLTQVNAATLLGVSQPYLSLLEKGARPLTPELRRRMRETTAISAKPSTEELVRARLGALGYGGFAHLAKSGPRSRPETLLMSVLARPDADARVVEALPWLVAAFQHQLDFDTLVRQAKLTNLQNRLGFLLQIAAVDTPGALAAIGELDRSRLLREDTMCWESMPAATREWMRANRTPLARHWNILTRLNAQDSHEAS